jgi:hypothetical protein
MNREIVMLNLKYSPYLLTAFLLTACGGEDGDLSLGNAESESHEPRVILEGEIIMENGSESIALRWSSENVDACTATGGWSGSKAKSGSETIREPNQNKNFSLKCTSSETHGVVTDSVDFSTAGVLPSITIEASPSNVTAGSTVTLTWAGSNVESCTASGAWSGAISISGEAVSRQLSEDSAFAIDCTGSFGDVSDVAYVFVSGDSESTLPPTVLISASPSSVAYNGESTLTWSSSNANNCIASGDWSGSRSTSGSNVLSGLTGDRSYTLTCSGIGGSAFASAHIQVAEPVSLPVVSIIADSSNIPYGGSTNVSWSAIDADSCTASGDWFGAKPTSGSMIATGLSEDTTYNLTCTGPGGSSSDSITINVADQVLAPVVSLTADRTSISYNESITLSWDSTNADYCTASGDWSGNRTVSGALTIDNITVNSTYTLTCSGPGGSSSDSVIISVSQVSNGTAFLSWTAPTENTDSTVLTDLSGYKIYYGKSPGNYTEVITINEPGRTSYQINNLSSGEWYFVVVALNSSDMESEPSEEVSKVI